MGPGHVHKLHFPGFVQGLQTNPIFSVEGCLQIGFLDVNLKSDLTNTSIFYTRVIKYVTSK